MAKKTISQHNIDGARDYFFGADPDDNDFERGIKILGDLTLGQGMEGGGLINDIARGTIGGNPYFKRDFSGEDAIDALALVAPFMRGKKYVKAAKDFFTKSGGRKKGLAKAGGLGGALGFLPDDIADAVKRDAGSTEGSAFDTDEDAEPMKVEVSSPSSFDNPDFLAGKFDRASMYKDEGDLEKKLMTKGLGDFQKRDIKDRLNKIRRFNADVDRKADIMDAGLASRAGRFVEGFDELSPEQQLASARNFSVKPFRDADGNLPIPMAPLQERAEAFRNLAEDRAEERARPKPFEMPDVSILPNSGIYMLGDSKARINPDGTSTVIGPTSPIRSFDENILEKSFSTDQSFDDYADYMRGATGVDPITNTPVDRFPGREPESGLMGSDLSPAPMTYDDYFDDPDTLLTSRLNNQVG